MGNWRKTSIANVKKRLFDVKIRHLTFILGSFVSAGQPSSCLSVTEVKRAVLLPLLKVLKSSDDVYYQIRQYLKYLSNVSNQKMLSKVGQALIDLPFEQFMACLYNINSNRAIDVIKIAHGGNRQPNDNHVALAALLKTLLEKSSIEGISILTTNYDQCIEHAVETEFHAIMHPDNTIPLPAFKMDLSNGKWLRYAKIHGCINAPSSLVFTVDQMGRLIADKNWIDRVQKWILNGFEHTDIAVSAGYGFWDPDLYELFKHITDGAILIRNVREQKALPNSILGRDILQADAFRDFTCVKRWRCISTLVKDKRRPNLPSILIDLYCMATNDFSRFNVPAYTKKQMINDMLSDVGKVLEVLSEDEKVTFWSRLLDALGRYEGAELFARHYRTTKSKDTRIAMAKARLYSYGNKNDWQGAIEASEELIKKSRSRDEQVLGYAYRSFILTVGDKNEILKAASDLRSGRKMIDEVSPSVRSFLKHLENHFWIKAIEAAFQGSGDWGRILGFHSILRKKAKNRALITNKMLEELTIVGDAEAIGDTMELLAQMRIISGEIEIAEKKAEDSQKWRSFTGRMSNTLQSDRLLAWVRLAQGGQENRFEAIRLFSRGLERALEVSQEQSLAKKLGANLVRAIWSDNIEEMNSLTGRSYDVRLIKAACRAIQKTPGVKDKNKVTVTQYVFNCYGKDQEALKSEIAKLANLQYYPIYLPLRA